MHQSACAEGAMGIEDMVEVGMWAGFIGLCTFTLSIPFGRRHGRDTELKGNWAFHLMAGSVFGLAAAGAWMGIVRIVGWIR